MAPKPLTPEQRKGLARLEPDLRRSVERGDYEAAKQLVVEIQSLLRATGHETRLMKAKCWLFEAAMEAGHLQTAMAGLIGIRKKTNESTRVHLEATALLAICHLRKLELKEAEPLISAVLKNESVIQSATVRRNFRRRVISRFQEETVLASVRLLPQERLDVDDIQNAAGDLLCNRSEAEIHAYLANALPRDISTWLERIDEISRRQLPPGEVHILPSPRAKAEPMALGKRVFDSAKRVLWRSLCDPKSDIYQAWFKNGIGVILDKKYFTPVVLAALTGYGLAIKALAISVVALILKAGLEVYCDAFKPAGLLDPDSRRG